MNLLAHPPHAGETRQFASDTCRVFVTAAVLLFSTALLLWTNRAAASSMAPSDRPTPGETLETHGQSPTALFEKTIRTAYSSLENYTARSGAGIHFELSNLATYGEDAFDDLRVIDIATMPEGRVIDVAHSTEATSYPSGESRVEVRYRASWRTQEANWRTHPETVRNIDRALDEVLPLMAQGDARFQDVRAVTTYDVTATLGEESRTYRASFYWFRPSAQSDWRDFDLLVVDHITQGVETALRETVPAAGMTVSAPDASATEDQSGTGNSGYW